uniref:Uncharacterized protein n=1 Tax=Siphoviridae sp. ct96x5 TaxID=2825367 RepID=A0A8S5PRP5_9CAUD|nr:MAG TPA: hypothetical protein [Siphoviridae sp. ct96x5]
MSAVHHKTLKNKGTCNLSNSPLAVSTNGQTLTLVAINQSVSKLVNAIQLTGNGLDDLNKLASLNADELLEIVIKISQSSINTIDGTLLLDEINVRSSLGSGQDNITIGNANLGTHASNHRNSRRHISGSILCAMYTKFTNHSGYLLYKFYRPRYCFIISL